MNELYLIQITVRRYMGGGIARRSKLPLFYLTLAAANQAVTKLEALDLIGTDPQVNHHSTYATFEVVKDLSRRTTRR